MLQTQVLLFGTFWIFFFFQIFLIPSWLNLQMWNPGYRGLTVFLFLDNSKIQTSSYFCWTFFLPLSQFKGILVSVFSFYVIPELKQFVRFCQRLTFSSRFSLPSHHAPQAQVVSVPPVLQEWDNMHPTLHLHLCWSVVLTYLALGTQYHPWALHWHCYLEWGTTTPTEGHILGIRVSLQAFPSSSFQWWI